MPLRTSPSSMVFSDPYSGMKRADLPLSEELIALQVVGGGLGLIVGPKMLGSSAIGITLGVVLGRWLAFEPGRRGASARELAYQLAQLQSRYWQRLKDIQRSMQASQLGVTEDMRDAVAGMLAKVRVEVCALDAALGVSAKARQVTGRMRSVVCEWADEKGISARLAAAWKVSSYGFGWRTSNSGSSSATGEVNELMASWCASSPFHVRGPDPSAP
eukprot:CAMPEP_0183332452 /NCGR_PEP_ID=MMETSP0164_2-20130417/1610_1 /TAXON_ID=221442 /ORGANISM="Coccolithus pelagicus ssp braarudi, Strain PLY182g" /LENGTH=215 /DNA_ID=CAMNT_0025501171 /DNA_START=188 /DNA_END=836 /DNA_ORIENTATION=+